MPKVQMFSCARLHSLLTGRAAISAKGKTKGLENSENVFSFL